jgi:predicted ATPase
MRLALARHDEILGDAIRSHRGVVVKTTGDGFLAVFAAAGEALQAAEEAQRQLHGEVWGSIGSLRVRMGVHTGEVELRDGDYYGGVVNRAARLMGVAYGGQVVCSAVTADLVRDGSLFEMRDLGEHRLSGLSRPERVWQLCVSGLPVEFPPLRSVQAGAGNLPRQLTSFVGREAEVAELAQLVCARSLVTLTGVGGVGKTRLALEVAAGAVTEFADGVWCCELAPVADPGVLWETLAATFGVVAVPGRPVDEMVLGYLAGKHLLLVLDNCEHVLDAAAAIVSTIERRCPRVVVLATSREGLGVAGEQLVAVRSLALPPEDAVEAALESADAVQLFCDRARRAKHDFTATGATLQAVGVLCRRLDGIPLAIELAAARSTSLAPQDLVARLDQRFKLLTRGGRASLERHQTMRNTIDWSYDLLDDTERDALQRFSVFAGGADLEAAEAVLSAGDLDALDVVDALAALVEKSLVMVDVEPGGSRYRMLETIRQYAHEQLEAAGRVHAGRTAHAQHFLGVAERNAVLLRGRDQLLVGRRLARDTENFRAVIDWAVETGDADLALRLVAALGVTGASVGDTALAWAETAVRIPGATTHRMFPAVASWAAWSATARGELGRATEYSALIDPAEAELGVRTPTARRGPAVIAFFTGDHDATRLHAQEWAMLARRDDDRYELANALVLLAAAQQFSGDPAAAVQTLEEEVSVARDAGIADSLSLGLMLLAGLLPRDELGHALQLLDEALAVAIEVGDRIAISASIGSKAWIAAHLGDHARALELAREAIQLNVQVGQLGAIGPSLVAAAVALAGIQPSETAALLLATREHVLIGQAVEWWEELIAQAETNLIHELGQTRYDALHARGADLSLDEAVALLSVATPDLS